MATSAHTVKIDHSDVPIRLFKSDFMEFFTHISPVTVLVIWAPVVAFFLYRSAATLAPGARWGHIPAGFVLGIIIWTFAEYTLHRYLFHYEPRTERQEKIFFLFHGVHHAQPQMKTRLVMPPVLSIPLAALFYGLYVLVVGAVLGAQVWVAPLFSGFILGYILYDITHYATHHFPMRSGYLRYLKRYHMKHHYKHPNALFGVSSPVWDFVFRTSPE